MMKNKMLVAVIAGLIAGGAYADGLSGSVGVMSDYVFRGASQTDQDMAVTGDISYAIGNLTLTGAATTVDKTVSKDRVELNAIANYHIPMNKTFSSDVGVFAYVYPGASAINTTEAYAALNGTFGDIGAQVRTSYTNDYFGSSRANWYNEVNVSYALPMAMSLGGHFGRETSTDKNDYKVSLSKAFGKSIVGEVAFIDTNVNTNLTDRRWTVAAKYQF
jgi:uncharacterized protein (TIGR02001 family)